MEFTFTPAIGEHVNITVPSQQIGTVRLCLTATLSSSDYELYKRSAVKLQLWSDILVDSRPSGEWGELDFQDVSAMTPPRRADRGKPVAVSLASDVAGRSVRKPSFTLHIALPPSAQSRFSFTYRLVYPNGEIRWLGQYGQNGTLAFVQGEPDIVLGEGWVPGEGGYTWNAADRAVENLEIAKLVNPTTYTVWAIGKDRSVTSTRLLLLANLTYR